MSDIDISPEAVEQLAHHDDIGGDALRFAPTLRALSAALTQSRAETAAAYERAAREVECGCGAGPCQDTANCAAKDAADIRALATPDQTAALDRMIAEAVAAKAAEIAQLNQDLDDMRDNAESAYRRGYWAGRERGMTDLIPRDAVRNVVAKLGQEFLDGGSPTAANVLNLAADRINAIPAIDPAAIRDAALKEAVKSLRDWQTNLNRYGYKETAITIGMSADVVEALIGEKK